MSKVLKVHYTAFNALNVCVCVCMYRESDQGPIFSLNPEGSKESEGESIPQGIKRSDDGKILKYTCHDIISSYDVISTRDPV